MKKKTIDVAKFGGVEELGGVKTDYHHDLSGIEVKSDRNLEDDKGEGNAVIIRQFKFALNPQVWHEVKPDKQALFNSHLKGIELALWKDGMKVFSDSEPRVSIDAQTGTYSIFVAAQPMKGHILKERPQTLSQIAHG